MKRRNFVKNTAISSALIVANRSLTFMSDPDLNFKSAKFIVPNNGYLFEDPTKDSEDIIDPLVPVRVFTKHEDEILSQIIEMHLKYGFKRFLLLAPDKTVRFSGFPESDIYSKIGELILRFKRRVASYNIKVGWEYSTTIKQGPGAPYQVLTGLDGRISEISFCPLDHNFRHKFSENIKTVVDIAHPFMIMIEDDFTLRHAGFGCFCPLHLAEFAQRQQQAYLREDLLRIFSTVTPESIKLRLAWADLCRNSLVSLAELVREKIDRIAPETRISLCQAGAADMEGNFTESVTRAFAGKTRPAVRLFGMDYGRDNAEKLPEILFNVLYHSQHLPNDFELYHETDSFPHTRFFVSKAKIRSLMTAAFAYGIDDSRFYTFQTTDNPLEEDGYANMFHEEVKRFNSLKSAVKDCTIEGCEIIYDPIEHVVEPYGKGSNKRYAWANVTGRLGIPHTSSNGKVKLVSGTTLEIMSDNEIKKLLGGCIFLDGKAAFILCKRGFSDFIGAEIFPGGNPNFLYEGISKTADFQNINGEIMYNFLLFGAVGTEGGSFFQLKPSKNVRILTYFIDGEENPVTPGLITYENTLGGRVAITAYDLNNNSSSGVINYKKKEIIRQVIEWLGKEQLPVFVKHLPNTFCIFNRAKLNSYAIVTIISLCPDNFQSFSLELAPEWINSKFELLNQNGDWISVKYDINSMTINVHVSLSLMSPVILKVTKDKKALLK